MQIILVLEFTRIPNSSILNIFHSFPTSKIFLFIFPTGIYFIPIFHNFQLFLFWLFSSWTSYVHFFTLRKSKDLKKIKSNKNEASYHYNTVDKIFDKIILHESDARDMLNIRWIYDAELMRFVSPPCRPLYRRPLVPNKLSSFWSSLRIASLSFLSGRKKSKDSLNVLRYSEGN